MWDASVEVAVGPVVAIPIPTTTTDQAVLRASGTLYGWSLRDAAGEVAQNVEGAVVAPAAGTTVVTTLAIPAGEYEVNWTVGLQGAAAAADANNFELIVGGNPAIPSINPGVAGEYPQVSEQVFVLNNQTILIKAIGAGTAGVTYSAQLSISPTAQVDTVIELRNSAQPIAEISITENGVDTKWFGPLGVDITNDLNLHMIQGAVTGAIYASFDKP